MDTYQETFETWDKISLLYQKIFSDLDLYNDTYDAFCKLILVPNPLILEIGCGPGNISKYILLKNSHYKIHGTDISPNMINLAKENNPTATFSILDARNIHEIKAKYHGIISGFTLPYLSIQDIEKLISNAKELLFKNGILYLSYVEGEALNSGFLTGKDVGRVYFYYHRSSDIISHLISNGFEIKKQFSIPYRKKDGTTEIHTVIISEKNVA